MGIVHPLFHNKFLYDYMLRKMLIVSIFNISTFSMALSFFLLQLIKMFPETHNFWNKEMVKHCLTMVKYFEATIKTKFLLANHYLTNSNTKN